MLSDYTEAFGGSLIGGGTHWETKENPQHVDWLATQYVHPAPKRHILGLVGGNEASLIRGNMVDLESDLRRIHLPLTFAPWRQYQPPVKGQTEIVRENMKQTVKIDVTPMHLPVYQTIAYPAVMAPLPIRSEVCMRPEKY